MKKRVIAMFLAAAMCVSLVACGSSSSSSSSETEETEETAEETEETEETAEESDEEESSSDSTSDTDLEALAAESDWPTDTVTFYVPASAGGGTDMLGRLFIQGLSEANGGNYIIVNDTTGNGSVAAETVRNADADGLNLLMYHTGICSSIASGQYAHTLDEFTICGLFITVVEECSAGIFVPADSEFDTLEDLIAYSQENPGELLAGVQNGSTSELSTVLLENLMDVEWSLVEAGSNADKVTALMGNQIDLAYMNIGGNEQYIESGDLKLLVQMGVSDDSPQNPGVPDTVPTLADCGYTGLLSLDMIGFIAGPADLSDEDVAAINLAIKGAVDTDVVQDGYAEMTTEVVYYSIEDATEMVLQAQENYNTAYALAYGE